MIAADRFTPDPLPSLAYVHASDGRTCTIWPKSDYALTEFLRLDAGLGRFGGALLQWAGVGIPAEHLVSDDVVEALRVWCWIVTSPTTELPFADDDADATPPDAMASIAWPDIMALGAAFWRVNAASLARLAGADSLAGPLATADSLLALARAFA